MTDGPLAGIRVVDYTDDSGRFATKLLAECGASVVRLGTGSPGPAMRDAQGGLLDWWYDGGKARASFDAGAYRALAANADLIVETAPPGELAALGVDHADLVAQNPQLVQVSLTPFGRTGPRSGWQTTDLVSAALGGVLSVSGVPDQPVVPWGRQAFNFGGFMAAICGLAGVRSAVLTGDGQHVDLSLHEVVASTVEQLFFQYWFDDVQAYPKIAPRQGSLHWIGAYEVVPAETGWIMTTITPNTAGAFGWMMEAGFEEVNELLALPPEQLIGDIPRIMKTLAGFMRTKPAGELFREGQARKIAFGEVLGVAQVAANEQHEFRGFFRSVDGSSVRIPGPVARFHGTPAPEAQAPDAAMPVWEPRAAAAPSGEIDKPLDGVRVLDFTHVLAGPFGCRILGDLGADVIKLQTAERATVVNDPNHPYFYTWNRSRRDIALNMKDERAVDVVRRLVEHADILIENFSAGVLDRWGLSYETVRSWNPRIVYVTMSGCGHEGPWSSIVTYAPTIHAISGLTYLSNPPGRGDVGPGFSLNDHAAGYSAAFAILSALEARERTGEGQHVDISQMETGTYLIGPALLDYLTNGREAQPNGNVDPFGVCEPNDCYPTSDGGFVAISCRNDTERDALASVAGAAGVAAWALGTSADDAQHVLQAHRVPAGKVQNAADLMNDPQLAARSFWKSFDHAVFGERPFDRFPAIWSGTSLEPYLPPPSAVGEHNFEVYPALAGIDEGEVAEGMADGLFT